MSSLARRTGAASLALHIALILLLFLWEYTALQPAKRPVKPITVKDIRIVSKTAAGSSSSQQTKTAAGSSSSQQTKTTAGQISRQKSSDNVSREAKTVAEPKSKPSETTAKKPATENKKKPTNGEKRANVAKASSTAASESKKAMLAKAKEALAKASTATKSVSTATASETIELPAIQALATEAEFGVALEDVSYENKLTYALQNQLTLPERGKVSVQLTITRLGKIVKILVVSSESERNRRYIESQLPYIIVYPFDSDMGDAVEKTFHIILSHKM
jgi:hypothetical protein